jgi:hypothetical protein
MSTSRHSRFRTTGLTKGPLGQQESSPYLRSRILTAVDACFYRVLSGRRDPGGSRRMLTLLPFHKTIRPLRFSGPQGPYGASAEREWTGHRGTAGNHRRVVSRRNVAIHFGRRGLSSIGKPSIRRASRRAPSRTIRRRNQIGCGATVIRAEAGQG